MNDSGQLDDRRRVYRLLSRVLLDIRIAAYEGKGQRGIFKLADLFHNVPAKLERAERQGGGFDALIDQLAAHADRNGSRGWLDDAMSKIDRSAPL